MILNIGRCAKGRIIAKILCLPPEYHTQRKTHESWNEPSGTPRAEPGSSVMYMSELMQRVLWIEPVKAPEESSRQDA